jgi:hypothetical protein
MSSVECSRRRLYQPSIHANAAWRAAWRVGQERRLSFSFFSDAKKLSQTALSSAEPWAPIERSIPASRQRWPKTSAVYWANSTGCRNA